MKKVVLLLGAITLSAAGADTVTVTDLAGRTVTVPENPQRVVLGEGRLLFATAILDREDPFKRIVAWKGDFINYAPFAYEKYKEKFPSSISKVRNLGTSTGDLSVEQMIADKADLVIFSQSHLESVKEAGLLDRLEKANIPAVFVDFRSDPVRNTVPSMKLLGKVLGKEAKSDEFNRFYNWQMGIVKRRVSKSQSRPLVFVDRAAGFDPESCCKTFGPANFGDFVKVAGGKNWGSSISDKFGFNVSPESVIKADPDIVIATGADWKNSIAVPLGYGANNDQVRQRLRGLTQRNGFGNLRAVRDSNFYAIYHQFYNSPYNVFAIQQMAKWMHPNEFKGIDPEANFSEMHRRFLPISYSGEFWTQLK